MAITQPNRDTATTRFLTVLSLDWGFRLAAVPAELLLLVVVAIGNGFAPAASAVNFRRLWRQAPRVKVRRSKRDEFIFAREVEIVDYFMKVQVAPS